MSRIKASVRTLHSLSSTFTFSWVFLLAAVAGCAVDENKEIALYRAVLDGPASRPATYEPGGSLSLTDALLLANQHNEQLAIAGEDFVQAMVEKDRAFSAFLPTITLVPSYSQADEASDGGGRRLNGGNTNDPTELAGRSSTSSGRGNWDTPINTNLNVFRGFRDVASLRRAGSDIEQFRGLLLDLKATVMLDVASAYYQVLRSESTVRVLEGSSQLQDARVSEMKARDRIGAGRKLDVAQAEAQAANTRAILIAARADVRNARTLLAFLTGAEVRDAPLIDGLIAPDLPPDIAGVMDRAYANRQDLQAARSAVESARQNVEVAVGQYYPSISINFNYYLSRMSSPDDSFWNGLLSFNIPLFTGGRIHADVRTAMSQFRQAVAREQYLRRQVLQQARTALENFDASRLRLVELRIAVEAAQQALDVAEGNYRAGSGIYLERLVAQDQLLNAQLQASSSEYNLKLNYLSFLRVIGELNDPPAEAQTQPATRPVTRPS